MMGKASWQKWEMKLVKRSSKTYFKTELVALNRELICCWGGCCLTSFSLAPVFVYLVRYRPRKEGSVQWEAGEKETQGSEKFTDKLTVENKSLVQRSSGLQKRRKWPTSHF